MERSGAVAEGSLPIRMGGRIAVTAQDRELAGWPVTVLPDFPPVARFVMPPRATSRHAFRIDYGGNDDYGVAAMRAEAAPVDEPAAGPLVLPLPVLGEPVAPQGNAYFDLTAHIWAGREVILQLFAVDGARAGGRGASAPLRAAGTTLRPPGWRAPSWRNARYCAGTAGTPLPKGWTGLPPARTFTTETQP